MRLATAATLAIMAISGPAAAQHRSPAAIAEAKKFLLPCDSYRGSDAQLCEKGQDHFKENYADAMAGRLDSWRNLAYFFTPGEVGATHYGIMVDYETSCMWRYAVVLSNSDEVWETDLQRLPQDCSHFYGPTFTEIQSRARDIVRRIKVIPDGSPKAPWYVPVRKIDPKCLDSTVTPLGGPTPPPFVPPPGCPKFP